MNLHLLTIIIIFALILILILFIKSKKSTRLSHRQKNQLLLKLTKIQHKTDPETKIFAYDKLLDELLTKLGYHGNLGAKLKNIKHFNLPLNKIWHLHKIRNNLAHNHKTSYSSQQLNKAANQFYHILSQLLK